jgi:hypothetical protein
MRNEGWIWNGWHFAHNILDDFIWHLDLAIQHLFRFIYLFFATFSIASQPVEINHSRSFLSFTNPYIVLDTISAIFNTRLLWTTTKLFPTMSSVAHRICISPGFDLTPCTTTGNTYSYDFRSFQNAKNFQKKLIWIFQSIQYNVFKSFPANRGYLPYPLACFLKFSFVFLV